jgi:hypothetical protein
LPVILFALTALPLPSILKVFYDATYHLNVGFSVYGADVVFDAKIIGTNWINFSGTLTGQAAAAVSAVGVDFDVMGDGDSFIAFDNLSAIPDPRSTFLVVIGIAGLLAHRRRG